MRAAIVIALLHPQLCTALLILLPPGTIQCGGEVRLPTPIPLWQFRNCIFAIQLVKAPMTALLLPNGKQFGHFSLLRGIYAWVMPDREQNRQGLVVKKWAGSDGYRSLQRVTALRMIYRSARAEQRVSNLMHIRISYMPMMLIGKDIDTPNCCSYSHARRAACPLCTLNASRLALITQHDPIQPELRPVYPAAAPSRPRPSFGMQLHHH
jgi:hypothetical protein